MATWTCFLLACVLSTILASAEKQVFQSHLEANNILQRPRRSNLFFLEEILQGNLERECYEETCTYEEAREYFEDIPKTEAFWAKYLDGDQCDPNPCLHDGKCTDKIGGYSCDCKELYDGVNCEKDVSQCHSEGPLSCDHFCRPLYQSYHCSCVEGYRLHTDGRTCLPEGSHSCGRAPMPKPGELNHTDRSSGPGSPHCPQGRCPWQVWLLDGAGREVCSGVLLGQRSILTTAACADGPKSILVGLGERDAGQHEQILPDQLLPRASRIPGQVLPVSQVTFHKRYRQGEPGDDLAFLQVQTSLHLGAGAFHACVPEKDFSENVLMESGQEGWVDGRRRGSPYRLTYSPLEQCQDSLNLTFPLTNKMFCMAGWGAGGWGSRGRGCDVLPGSPIVSIRRNTTFLTGLVTSIRTHDCSQGHVFIKLSRYVPWILQQLEFSEK